MRKFLLSLAFVLFASPVLAQNITCPDRPHGDSTNACANTRFVQQNAGGGGGGSPGGLTDQIQYNNAGTFGGFTANGDATINTSTGTVVVTKSNGTSFGNVAFQNLGNTFTQTVINYACSTASTFLWNNAGNWVCRNLGQLAADLGIPVPMTLYSPGNTSNDTAGVQAAFTACTSSGCLLQCQLNIVYTIDTITVGNNTTVENCNFKQRVTGTRMFTMTGVSNVAFLSNIFTGNTVSVGLAAPVADDVPLTFVNANYIKVMNNKFSLFGLYESSYKNSSAIINKGNYNNSVAFGPRFYCSTYIRVDGNTYNTTSLYSTTPTSNQVAIGPMLDSDVCGVNSFAKIVNNTLINFPYSQAYQVHSGNYVVISNNIARAASICVGINSYANYDSISRIAVTGNVCEAPSSSITLPTNSDIGITALWNGVAAKPFWITINSNVLIGFAKQYVSGSKGCITTDSANYMTITGNVIQGCGGNGIAVFGDTPGLAVTGNSISDITTVSGSNNGVFLANNISGSGIIASNIMTSLGTNVNNPSGNVDFKYAGLNACKSVSTCN